MRTKWTLLTLTVAAVVMAGCAQPTTSTSGSPTPSADPAAFSKCMRAHGLPDFPDPDPDTGTVDSSALKPGDPTYDKALASCKTLLPAGRSNTGKMDEATLNQWRAYAQCMRQNGLPSFPDPDPNSGGPLFGSDSGIDRTSPAFQKATKACQGKRPTTGGGQ